MPVVILVIFLVLLSFAMVVAMVLAWPVALLAGLVDAVGSTNDAVLTTAAWVAALSLVAFGVAVLLMRWRSMVALFSGRRRSEWSAPFVYGGVVYLIGGGAMGALLILEAESLPSVPVAPGTVPVLASGPTAIVFAVAAVLILAPAIRWTVVPALSALGRR